jgi:NAD(P)-dependent dehydrogenase (short-subunit alcohol dehydrogenase family)
VPALWLKSLLKVLKGSQDCIVAALSARVGSIGDNHLGGWYAYRASKSALNMILKTAAIEYGRRAKNVKLIAFHPGTTDTELSKPFQAAVPKEKLFTPSFVAERLAMIMDEAVVDGELSYLDWKGQAIDW